MVQPGAARDSARRRSGSGWTTTRSSRSTASPSRISTGSRNTCSTRRASGCCRSRAGSRRRRATHMRRSRPRTCSFRRSRSRTASEVTVTYGQYRAILATRRKQADRAAAFAAFTRSTRPASTPTRRSTTACCSATGSMRRRAATDHARGGAARQQHPDVGRREPDRHDASGRRAAAPLSPAAATRARPAVVSRLRLLHSARHLRSEVSVRRRARLAVEAGRAARPRISGAHAARLFRRLDRRLRERGQAVGRVLGARVRHAPVHAPELQRHARRRVHAGARDGALDAHHPVARDAAVRVFELHDLRRRSAVDAERGAVPRLHARAHDAIRRERIVLLQHAIDSIVGTFYTQVLFADYELQAHRLAEQDKPITAGDPDRDLLRRCSRSTTATRST